MALADAACPSQEDGIPESLLKKLQPGKINGFLCLGDIGAPILSTLRRVSTDIKRVAGPAEDEQQLPETLVRCWLAGFLAACEECPLALCAACTCAAACAALARASLHM